jgi:mercuric ion transport protein
MTKDRKFIVIGGAGALAAALCCFTPLLVVGLGALGLSALVGWWLDLILFPALAFFLMLLGYGTYLKYRRTAEPVAARPGDNLS